MFIFSLFVDSDIYSPVTLFFGWLFFSWITVKVLHDAVEANKAAAARCNEKVVAVEAAAAGTPVD